MNAPIKTREQALREYIARNVAQDMDTADFIKECRAFWASYSNASVEVQNDAAEERNKVLQEMDQVASNLTENAAAGVQLPTAETHETETKKGK